mmetsp:Transcript_149212/g.387987  ORF Transcript_149212/g.387987 Transcript_149212/m.387987 type:complete len:923 (+) Transcript_149212:48-2816(+)
MTAGLDAEPCKRPRLMMVAQPTGGSQEETGKALPHRDPEVKVAVGVVEQGNDDTCQTYRGDHRAPDANVERCPLCCYYFGNCYWPFIRVPWRGRPDGERSGECWRLCHLDCVRKLLFDSNDFGRGLSADAIETGFVQDLTKVLEWSPQLYRKAPHLRVCFEEQRLSRAAQGEPLPWPPPASPAPPLAAFSFEGLVEIRISACPALRKLPPEIGRIKGVKTLVMISTGLVELAAEVGQLHELEHLFLNGNFLRSLPASVGALPNLTELCLDANRVEYIPPLQSPYLKLITAPANHLTSLPPVASECIERIEAHGNALSSAVLPAALPCHPPQWDKIVSLKLMGNQIRELPAELANMSRLRIAMFSSNRLRELPACVASLGWLEWLFAYDNDLHDLPEGLLKGHRWLERVLLEGNPLSATATARLISNVREGGNIKLRALGLDEAQVRTCAEAAAGACDVGAWQVLPPCISVGKVVHVSGSGQYWMKLTRSSQLRRLENTPAVGEPGGPVSPSTSPARFLVVAFSASQGEPEWLGLLRRLWAQGQVRQGRCPNRGSLEDFFRSKDASSVEACTAALWSSCLRGQGAAPAGVGMATSTDGLASTPPLGLHSPSVDEGDGAVNELADFDVLSVVDHRMRWYSEDAASFSHTLREVARPYQQTLCLGASMGGFGALLHGGQIADVVVAFSPQANLLEACLRPPGVDPAALEALANSMFDSVRGAAARGARITVHTAADEHLLHALALPQEAVQITVHPLLPRKPFARLLDRAGVLMPIVCEAVAELLQRTSSVPLVGAARDGVADRFCVASWLAGGGCERYSAPPEKVLNLFFGPGAHPPRPGDWFCSKCHRRNMSAHFFCWSCGPQAPGANLLDVQACRIPGGQNFPRKGDWGCGNCGQAHCSYQLSCDRCGLAKEGGHPKTVIVS